ncbi:MAG: ATP-binding protein [Bacteroidetes bacterium]|nr:ATP-binding protein [Bacteroidota bacterium]MCW5894404.1 ATP-binding protein [Bacteroidota bacterium]
MLFLSLVLVLLGGVAFGQQPAQLNFRHFRVEDGLSQGSINAILQDHKGFIWIGTHDGLNRFDGVEFKVFRHNPGNPRSLSSSWIVALFEDSNHVLWIKTEKGLDRFDRASESFMRLGGISHAGGMHTSKSGEPTTFWVPGSSLGLLDPVTGAVSEIHVSHAGETLKGPLQVLAEESNGHVWARDNSAVYKINLASRSVTESYNVGGRAVTAVEPSRYRKGVVWIGTLTGLLRIENGVFASAAHLDVRLLREDSQGDLWIATYQGLARLRRGTGNVELFRHDPMVPTSLSHDVVTTIFEDASGSLWVGTYRGLDLFDRFSPAFSVYRSSPDKSRNLGDSFVIPIVEDGTGDIWFGTFSAGVSVLHTHGPKAGTFTSLRYEPQTPRSLRNDNIRSLVCTRDGRVWIGSHGGLNIYDPTTKLMTSVRGILMNDGVANGVESMCEARDGSVWLPLRGKLLKLRSDNPANVVSYRIPELEYASVYEDLTGLVWLGTVGSGLVRFDPRTETVLRYRHEPGNPSSLSNDNVWTVLESPGDTSGTLWVGTSNGLNRINPNTGICKRYLEQEGFPNSWVYGILEDDLRRLWLSTNDGLVLFDDNQPEGRKFRNFTREDGIAGDEFNRRSFCRLRNGEFLFGGPNGVTRFHPAQVGDNPTIPPLVMTDFYKLGKKTVFDKDIADVTSIEMNHDENVFSFEFAALNYSNPSKNRYAYMMEGIDKDWIHAGGRRSVNYAYVPSGEYVFRVKASHITGVWNNNELAVHIRVHPAFWATWWFIALVVLAGGGVVTTVVRARVRRLLEIERLRSRIARDLHDEIGSNLSSIAMASDLLKRQRGLGEKEQRKLSEISSVALDTVKDMKDIVWLIKPGNDSIDDLFLRMKDTAATLLEGCRYSLSFPNESVGRKVDLEWRQHVYLIFKEALTNIAKHARAGNVSIAVAVEGDNLAITIEDDGKGFNPASATNGSGLRNMQERADILKAQFTVAATPAGGTRITLTTRIT